MMQEEENFARFFKLDEVRIITAGGRNVGWIQEQVDNTSINLGSFYIMQEMHGMASERRFFGHCWRAPPTSQKRLRWPLLRLIPHVTSTSGTASE
jgi:hypothetical protein